MLRNIKSIGNTLIYLGSFFNVPCVQHIEGNFTIQSKLTQAFNGSKMPSVDVKVVCKESEITSITSFFYNSVFRSVEIDCTGITSINQCFANAVIDEVTLEHTESCSNASSLFQNSTINKCSGLTLEGATNISNLYQSSKIFQIDSYLKGLQGDNVLVANNVFNDCKTVYEVEDIIIPNCTSINSFFRNCQSLIAVGTCNFSSITSATDAFYNVKYLKKISFVEESIPIPINFGYSKLLELESAKSIIKGLKNYAGTDKEFTYTIQFSAETLAILEADGTTAPDGGTWVEYAQSKGWNI
jgi:hypothetical protein